MGPFRLNTADQAKPAGEVQGQQQFLKDKEAADARDRVQEWGHGAHYTTPHQELACNELVGSP